MKRDRFSEGQLVCDVAGADCRTPIMAGVATTIIATGGCRPNRLPGPVCIFSMKIVSIQSSRAFLRNCGASGRRVCRLRTAQ